MRFLTSRALSAGLQAIVRKPTTLTPRAPFSSAVSAGATTYKTHVSYKPNPLQRPTNPNKKNKIPYKERPMKQPFVPLPTKNPEQLGATLRYIIRRTPASQLAVYRKWMSGGNRTIVIIKKVDGDRSQLVKDLTRDLGIKPVDIRINPTTQHIEVKGDVYDKVIQWVLKTGF
ncbi:mitochondrial large ribosomal subunit l49 [Fusarium heterosporum]|uniref:Large ribosomal subunit protein mL49 n=1 Tax=Fusarium heterosporum TaxID=42747 RepID=A0A8H5SIR9_FUSHE|nr:mitochondrial large ribosomal subunit l49 [Fusarium heterosporum]